MTIKQWYNFLNEQEYTVFDDASEMRISRKCKVENLHPDVNWKAIWPKCRHSSLNGDMSSFTFKLLHDLLPIEERLSKVLRNTAPACKLNCPGDIHADTEHVFFLCPATRQVGDWLLNKVLQSDPQASPSSILKLDIVGGTEIIWIVIFTLRMIWEKRTKGKPIKLENIIASMDCDLNILLKTKHEKLATQALNHIYN